MPLNGLFVLVIMDNFLVDVYSTNNNVENYLGLDLNVSGVRLVSF